MPEPTTTLPAMLDVNIITSALVPVHRATWMRWNHEARTPAAVRCAGRLFWRRDEILVWLDRGMPDRRKFEQIWKAESIRRRAG